MRKNKQIIRSTKHTLRFANFGKKLRLKEFLQEYRRVAEIFGEFLWNSHYEWQLKNEIKILDIKNNQFDCSINLLAKDTKSLNIVTPLSARAVKCISGQVCGMIRSILEKPRKRQFMLEKLEREGKDTKSLKKKIKEQKLTKPNFSNIKAELCSICCEFIEEKSNSFDGFLNLHCLGKRFGKIIAPVKMFDRSNHWAERGAMMHSFLVSENFVEFRWEISKPEEKSSGVTVGADQGMKTILVLSNEISTPKVDIHDHSLEKIIQKLARKKPGSRAFKRAQEHRKNFINWSINKIDLENIQEIRLEDVSNITYKRRQHWRPIIHWTNTLIKEKLQRRCEGAGVRLILVPSAFRSQRCSSCGWVQNKNRNGKQFVCQHCGHSADADLNAAKNLAIDLPKVPFWICEQKVNKSGFLWKPDGFFNALGE